VTLPALVAFVVPIAVFVVALGGFGGLLEGKIAPSWQTPLALILALLVTSGWMIVICRTRR
jgi:hypothetical protein